MADNNERTPKEWREILRNGIEYPEEARTGSRRDRRRARRTHRQDARNQTKEWIREERRRDPIKPAGALIIVCVLLALGAGARWLWPGLIGAHHGGTRVQATASPNPSSQNGQTSSAPTASPSSSSAVDLSNPDHVAQEAVQLYLTRNPPVDGDHKAAVLRAAPYMAPSLIANLVNTNDPAFDKLVSNGGVSSVRSVQVGPADPKLPPDSPLRVWRKTTATVDVQGYTKYTDTTALQVEVTVDGNGAWHVTRILGLE